jgi:hypothetical protein
MFHRVRGLLLVLGALVPFMSQAVVLTVPGAYPTIQSAIDAAPAGATVRVSPGTYRENLRIEKALKLVSTDGAESTILDGRAKDVVVWVYGAGDGSEAVTISGFTITNGRNLFDGGNIQTPGTGGGVRAENVVATIVDNTITHNAACRGSGIFTQMTTVSIRRNTIRQNNVECGGDQVGGVFLNGGGPAPSEIAHNVIAGHRFGGGVRVNAVEGVRIESNIFRNNHGPEYGGGLSVYSSSADVVDNTFVDNSTPYGGGGLLLQTDLQTNKARVRNNTFRDNQSPDGSAAVLRSFYDQSIRFVHNDVSASSAGGLVSCDVFPVTIPRNNALVNRTGPALGGNCIEGRP